LAYHKERQRKRQKDKTAVEKKVEKKVVAVAISDDEGELEKAS